MREQWCPLAQAVFSLPRKIRLHQTRRFERVWLRQTTPGALRGMPVVQPCEVLEVRVFVEGTDLEEAGRVSEVT